MNNFIVTEKKGIIITREEIMKKTEDYLKRGGVITKLQPIELIGSAYESEFSDFDYYQVER